MNAGTLHYNILHKWWYLPFVVYVVPNVLMSFFVIAFNLLLVDGVPVPLVVNSFVIIGVAVAIIACFYYVKFLSRYYNKKAFAYKSTSPSKYIGNIIFVLQFFDLLSLLLFDFGRVGGLATSGNLFVRVISYLPTDTLFLLYYGHHRKKGVPVFNLSLYLLVNILKGWTGIWLVLFFIEIYFQLQKLPFNKIAKRVLIAFAIIFALYPTINKYKYLIRGGEDYQQRTLLESTGELAIRLQHATNVILMAQEAPVLKAGLDNGSIIPYYFDNRIGSYFAGPGSMSIQKFLSVNYLIDKDLFSAGTDIEELGWFVHVGIAGWLFVLSPLGIFFYIIFITILIAIPFILNHYFLKAEGLIPVIQTLTLTYVFHGWFTVHVGFIFGVMLYITFNAFFISLKKEKLAKSMALA